MIADRSLTYLPQLDGLRAIAVAAVLQSHFYPDLLGNIPAGYYGVRLFFVLSGYLITRILLDCRELRDAGVATTRQLLGRFYGRRALRLFPTLWVALAIGSLYLPAVREQWLWHVTYLSNFYFITTAALRDGTGHLWTLAVEEQFYLVWPILVLGLAAWKLKPLIIVLVVAAPLTRFYVAHIGGNLTAAGTTPWACADALGIGALLALALATSPDPARICERARNWGIPFGVLSIAAVRLLSDDTALRVSLTGLAAACLSVGLVAGCISGFSGTMGRALESRPAVGLGRISYGVYVYHFFLIDAYAVFSPRWMPQHPGWFPPQTVQISIDRVLYFLILSSLTIAVAAASWRWIEQPALRLKRWLPYEPERRVPALQTVAPRGVRHRMRI